MPKRSTVPPMSVVCCSSMAAGFFSISKAPARAWYRLGRVRQAGLHTGIAEIAKGVTGKRLFRHWPLKKFDVDSIVLGSIARADWSGFVQGNRRPGAVDHLLDVVNGRFSHA